jgi:hypothetical protein
VAGSAKNTAPVIKSSCAFDFTSLLGVLLIEDWGHSN